MQWREATPELKLDIAEHPNSEKGREKQNSTRIHYIALKSEKTPIPAELTSSILLLVMAFGGINKFACSNPLEIEDENSPSLIPLHKASSQRTFRNIN